jgi:CheY-like chemotaxis protein
LACATSCARRRPEAQEELKYHAFDLILTNSALPEMDGYDLTRWLRREADEANRMTPVIIVTSHTRRSQVEKARDCGANFIVTKPISPAIMLERILWVAGATGCSSNATPMSVPTAAGATKDRPWSSQMAGAATISRLNWARPAATTCPKTSWTP